MTVVLHLKTYFAKNASVLQRNLIIIKMLHVCCFKHIYSVHKTVCFFVIFLLFILIHPIEYVQQIDMCKL